jgi:uncharacterized protein YfaS (alpha-2-macroglobulin family)
VDRLLRSRSNGLAIDREASAGTFGTGPLYYLARLHYYLNARDITPLSNGVSVSRRYTDLAGHVITSVRAGTAMKVQLTVHTDASLYYLDIEDPIPAGCEPIDETLQTSQQGLATFPPWWAPIGSGTHDLFLYLSHSDLRDDRVSLYAYFLPPGTYHYTYLATATVPGRYSVAPTHAQETFFPEVFGRGAGEEFTIR